MNTFVTNRFFRHFKGEYYYVLDLAKDTGDERTALVIYTNVCHPEYGVFARPVKEFFDEEDSKGVLIKDRKDNITGQSTRFKIVKDLNFQIEDLETEVLLKELLSRNDCPLTEIDFNKESSKLFSREYVIGVPQEKTEDYPKGVKVHAICDSFKEAKDFLEKHPINSRERIFKRLYIEQDF